MEKEVAAGASRGTARRAPMLVGIAFAVSWIVGLGLARPTTDVSMSGDQIVAAYAGAESTAFAQFSFTEGLPAIALGLMMVFLSKYVAASGRRALGSVILVSGLAAAALSLVQFGLGAYLCLAAVPAGEADAAKAALDAINRVDGVKMLLISVFSFAGFLAARRGGSGAMKWLSWSALALSASVLASAIGYLFLVDALSVAAYASLPLLLIWIVSIGEFLGTTGANAEARIG